jgi:hypothetical protein
MEWMAHCGCRLEIRPEDGEPIAFNQRCERHQTAKPEDVSGENRAMSLARKALEDSGVDPETITTEVDPATGNGLAHGPNGETAEAPKVTLQGYLDAHPQAAERFVQKG